jgi:hypothetical protein
MTIDSAISIQTKKLRLRGIHMHPPSIALKIEYSSPSPRKTHKPYTPVAQRGMLPCEWAGAINLCFLVRGAGEWFFL